MGLVKRSLVIQAKLQFVIKVALQYFAKAIEAINREYMNWFLLRYFQVELVVLLRLEFWLEY